MDQRLIDQSNTDCMIKFNSSQANSLPFDPNFFDVQKFKQDKKEYHRPLEDLKNPFSQAVQIPVVPNERVEEKPQEEEKPPKLEVCLEKQEVNCQQPTISPKRQQNLSVQPTKNRDISINLARLFQQCFLQKKHQASLILSGCKIPNKQTQFNLRCNLCSASPLSQIIYACQSSLSFVSCKNCIRYQKYQLPYLTFISFTDLQAYNHSLEDKNPNQSLSKLSIIIKEKHQKRNVALKKILNDIPFPELKINA